MIKLLLLTVFLVVLVHSQQDDALARKLDDLDMRSRQLLTRIPRHERLIAGQLRSEVFNFLIEFEAARLQMLKRAQIDPMMDYKMRRILARIQAKFKTKYPVIKARLHRLVSRLFSPVLMPFMVFEPALSTDNTHLPLDNSVTLPPFTQEQGPQWLPQSPLSSPPSNQFISNIPQWNSVPYNFPYSTFYYPNLMPSSQFGDTNLVYYPYRYRYRS